MKPHTQPGSSPLEWVRSSYSGDNGNCVEVAVIPGGSRALRDSKDSSGPVLTFSTEEFTAFVAGAVDGEFSQV
ncbi:DUF397 domain-containing protein [Streptomyces sp. NBC_01288]|uniref:DUF397 domain-containing protein n=1 Tax=Streptomyces sp. NBC_01288 TaxID=2903814 RepID=UPI002E138DAC|nr:DUF397 domain-containing protein [Streptomyces sp. NBC_01288]